MRCLAMRNLLYSEKEEKRRLFAVWIFVLLAAFQLLIISMFSAQTGTISGGLSRILVEKIKEILFAKGNLKGGNGSGLLVPIVRKTAHFYNFALLGFLLATIDRLMRNRAKMSVGFAVFGLFSAMLDELHQYFVPGRSAQISDVLIDFSGVLFGFCLLAIFWEICFKHRGAK